MEIDPASIDTASRYKLLIGCIVPRPIAVVGTTSVDGRANLAPFSFFTGIGSSPMTLLFCPVNRPDGGEKDTLRNAKPVEEGGTGEFVVSVATEAYARQVAGAAEPLEYGESEFELVGLTPEAGRVVRGPRVAESPVAFECRTERVIRTNPGQPAGGNIVIGRVVHVFVRDGIVDARLRVDQGFGAIGRMGGKWYGTTRDRFEMEMGRGALGMADEVAE